MPGRSYHPQLWPASGRVNGTHILFDGTATSAARRNVDVTGMEASLPSPPPPYHPPSPTTTRTFLGGSATPSGPLSPTAVDHEQTSVYRSVETSPQVPYSPSFPPPPGTNKASGRQSARNLLSLSRLPFRSQDTESRAPLSIDTNPISNPPSARRAHSTGAIGLTSTIAPSFPVAASSPQPQQPWQAGMPMPPPPPGPPPQSSRSASSSRLPDRPVHAPIAASRGPSTGLGLMPLSPVPPTPADFVDEDATAAVPRNNLMSTATRPPVVAPSSRLTRHSAPREASVEGIRDRRSKSRALREGLGQDHPEDETYGSGSAHSKPANLLLRRSLDSSTRDQHESPRPSQDISTAPNTNHAQHIRPPTQGMPTTPHTPANRRQTPRSASRSISRHPHRPPEDASIDDQPVRSAASTRSQQQEDGFLNESMERYLEFTQNETAASSDDDRLVLFARFLVEESRLRRERYATSFNKVASVLYDITRDMWRPSPTEAPSTAHTDSFTSREQSVDSPRAISRAGSFGPAVASSTASEAELTPATTDSESFCGVLERDQGAANSSPWNERFKPSLSPIPSMTVSAYNDEADSRGRSASRWWEASDNESSGTGARRLERTRQEIKYMSLHPSVMQQALEQQIKSDTSLPADSDSTTRADEYPPEKAGWHEPEVVAGPSRSSSLAAGKRRLGDSVPPVPNFGSKMPPLDVSRLVTLPPPFPRHYPAVSNCHPQLEAPRSRQRDLADMSDLKEIYDKFEETETSVTQEVSDARNERVRAFRAAVQADIDAGRVSHGMAVEADRRFRAHEAEKSAAAVVAAYERFCDKLHRPAKELLDSKLQDAEECINMMHLALGASMSSGASERAQVSGDEEPELLEQLTLLKWLFESRESLYKDLHDLQILEQSKLRAKDKWSRSYRSLPETLREADNARWQRSMQALQTKFACQSNARFKSLKSTVESHVARGVETQVSAFWDVAPPLLDVIQNVPSTPAPTTPEAQRELDDKLRHLPILIPPSELTENEDLRKFPSRHLYNTLSHARNSTRQFIDAQIDLLCLQHEIQSAAMAAEVRALETQRVGAGEDGEEVGREMMAAREAEETRMDGELRARVKEVEAGWKESLGDLVEEKRSAVRGFLERCGGWEGVEG